MFWSQSPWVFQVVRQPACLFPATVLRRGAWAGCTRILREPRELWLMRSALVSNVVWGLCLFALFSFLPSVVRSVTYLRATCISSNPCHETICLFRLWMGEVSSLQENVCHLLYRLVEGVPLANIFFVGGGAFCFQAFKNAGCFTAPLFLSLPLVRPVP